MSVSSRLLRAATGTVVAVAAVVGGLTAAAPAHATDASSGWLEVSFPDSLAFPGSPAMVDVFMAYDDFSVQMTSQTPDVCDFTYIYPVGGGELEAFSSGTCSVTVTDTSNGDSVSADIPVRSASDLRFTTEPSLTMTVGSTQTLNLATSSTSSITGSLTNELGRAGPAAPCQFGDTIETAYLNIGTTPVLKATAVGTCVMYLRQAMDSTYGAGLVYTRIEIVEGTPGGSVTTTVSFPGTFVLLTRSVNNTFTTDMATLAGSPIDGVITGTYTNDRTRSVVRKRARSINDALVAMGLNRLPVELTATGTAADARTLTVFAETVSQRAANLAWSSTPRSSLTLAQTTTLAATSSSDAAVTYASTTPAVCTVTGDVVSPVAAGDCIVQAAVAATATFSADTTTATIAITDTATADTTVRFIAGTALLTRSQQRALDATVSSISGSPTGGTITVTAHNTRAEGLGLMRARSINAFLATLGVPALDVVIEPTADASATRDVAVSIAVS